jgi:hypothetical protein
MKTGWGIHLISGPTNRCNRIIVWRPRVASNARIMAQAIRAEEIAAKEAKRAFEPWLAIHGFNLLTGGLRLSNSEANYLLVAVARALEEEGTSCFEWEH